VVCHHTASGPNWQDGHVAALLRDGRRDLSGPLAQIGLERDGTVVLIAAGRCNHNGYGLWGNDSYGIEAYNDGLGEPWPAAQLDAYRTVCRVLCEHHGWDPITRVMAHRETDPGRKIDPTGIDMPAFRTAVAASKPAPPAPPPPLEDDDMPLIILCKGQPPRLLDGPLFVPLDAASQLDLVKNGVRQATVSPTVYEGIRAQVIRALDEE